MNLTSSLEISCIFFIFYLLLHLIICRISSNSFFMKIGLSLALVFVGILIIYEIYINKFDLVSIYLLFTLCLSYLMFFINLLNSVTLKMLAELAKSSNGQLASEQFDHFFNSENGINSRLNAMKKNGFFIEKDDSLLLTNKSILLINIITIIRKIFSIDFVG